MTRLQRSGLKKQMKTISPQSALLLKDAQERFDLAVIRGK